MTTSGCMYCEKNEKLHSLMDYVCDVDGFDLYLNKNQAHRGRVVLVCNSHVSTIADMDSEKYTTFFCAVRKVIKGLAEAYRPDQINIGMFGDTVTHVHCHIVPKYKDGIDWNSTFSMNPQPPVTLTVKETESEINRIKHCLS